MSRARRDPSAQSGTATAFSGGRDRTRDNATTDKRSCCRAIFPARSSIKLLFVQFGEGGAGTFSDGKLYSQVKDPDHYGRKVLTEFVKAGAPSEILYIAKPHIGIAES